MVVRAASLLILPELAIFLQIIDRRRIWITIVEVPDFPRDIKQRRIVFPLLIH